MAILPRLFFIVAASSGVALSAGAQPAPVAVVADTPAITEAKANRPRVKTPPSVKESKIAWYLAELAAVRLTGQSGKVMVEGIIGVDGRYTDLRVRTSSRGAALDALALKTAGALQFVPAKDAAAKPIAIWALYPFDFDVLDADTRNVATYRCDMAVRDWNWWRAAWPELPKQKFPNYNFFTGFELLAKNPADRTPSDVGKRLSSFSVRWDKAFEICRSAPTRLFEEVLRTAPPA